MNSAEQGSGAKVSSGFVRRIAWLTLAVLTCVLPSLAQPQVGDSGLSDQAKPGMIDGTVVDGTRAAVVGARVVLTRKDHSLVQEVRTSETGAFSFANVAPGDFQITVTAAGFAPQTSSGTLHPGETYFAPSNALAPATRNTVVEVTPSTAYEVAEQQIKVEEKQRVIGVFPNFYISYDKDALSLAKRQKFELAWKSMIDPVNIVLTGATAGVQQAQNDYSGFGQGAQGYAKRFGAGYADNVIDTLLEGAVLPSLLKQDPRYFYKGTGSVHSRVLYAVGTLFVCKGDNKRWQPNYSGILGGLAAGGISNLYYPAKDRGAELTIDNTLIGLGSSAAMNLLQEFVIRRFTPNARKNDPGKP